MDAVKDIKEMPQEKIEQLKRKIFYEVNNERMANW